MLEELVKSVGAAAPQTLARSRRESAVPILAEKYPIPTALTPVSGLPPRPTPPLKKRWKERHAPEVLFPGGDRSPGKIPGRAQVTANSPTSAECTSPKWINTVALTRAAKRQQLLTHRPSYFRDKRVSRNLERCLAFPTSGGSMYKRALDQASDLELSKVLEPGQRARWVRLCHGVPPTIQNELDPSPLHRRAICTLLVPEPETLEAELSDFLCERARRHTEAHLARITLIAEDISRTARLSAEASAVLATAAKGVLSNIDESWKRRWEAQIRVALGASEDPSVWLQKNALSSFYPGVTEAPEKLPLWLHTLESVLSPTQRAAWQKELDARASVSHPVDHLRSFRTISRSHVPSFRSAVGSCPHRFGQGGRRIRP